MREKKGRILGIRRFGKGSEGWVSMIVVGAGIMEFGADEMMIVSTLPSFTLEPLKRIILQVSLNTITYSSDLFTCLYFVRVS